MTIRVKRDTLAVMLRSHGEDELAERVGTLTEDEMARIGRLGAYYAWSEDALALDGRGSMGGARALSFATIDVIEGTGRDPRHSRAWNSSEGPDPIERNRDRELRLRAAEKQRPAKWGESPANAAAGRRGSGWWCWVRLRPLRAPARSARMP